MKAEQVGVKLIETLIKSILKKNTFSEFQLVCTWVKQLPGHVFQAVDLFLLRSMNYHGGGAQDAEQAAELPVQV